MNIQVTNNNSIVFEGNSNKFLKDNQFDEDVNEMIEECKQKGFSEGNFISGVWECRIV
jgi:hypothetical protein